jgi:hypothetical protein
MVGITVIGMLFPSFALADELRRGEGNPHSYEGSSNVLINSFLLNFSQRYYRAVESSLEESSYFAFRYYLNSPFESFDKQQFISENPSQANKLLQDALQNFIRKTVGDIELVSILRDHLYAVTNLQMRIGSKGTRLQGPSLTRPGFENSDQDSDRSEEMTINSGLTFADDLRLGLKLVMGNRLVTSRLNYYPTSGNEIGYTAETQLTASSKIGMSYLMSKDNKAVVTTLSVIF